MKAFDRLLIFVTASGIWALAAMYYLTEFRAGATPTPRGAPPSVAVFNDKNEPLKVSGTVDAQARMNCVVKGKIVTQKPAVRLFGPDEWKPEKEWPVELTLECK